MKNRLNDRLIKFWNNNKYNDFFLDIKELNIKNLEIADLWHKCLLLSIHKSEKDYFKYEYIGADLIELFGKNIIGSRESFSNLSYTPISKIIGKMNSPFLVKSFTPIVDEGRFEFDDFKKIKYRSCLLPLLNKTNELTHLIIGINWALLKR